ncbi:MAG TPA: bifunctional 2-C-methyl-D-erythritol 4-phosphate cytidylyltransferase/2-C-methyl-D-erythritol 2,4-cyclodiphosphate synthase [Bauldia sp.]|nr:bifunctional 2-C-methyl-D-erythritol 4-phosphate cytidylyltransferase/2-C-methyl-D-erythritol 2,4-cyclodiphosphate synthase [Bauldia sp.]
MKTAAIIVAAGRGSRAGSGEIPKQYQPVGGVSVLRRSLETFLDSGLADLLVPVIGPDDAGQYAKVAPQHDRLAAPITGGATRQASVRAGLAALADSEPDRVLIHDAARPFAGTDLIQRVVAALDAADAVVPVLPVASTLKAVTDGMVTATVSRAGLFTAETPQGFRYELIRQAHEKAAGAGHEFTDDAAVAEWVGIRVKTVAGDPANVKLTTAEDIAAADRRLTMEAMMKLGDIRVGVGYDVHPFGPGDDVMLGGIAVPHTRGLLGHSDADVMLHALTDAVLGAIGAGDIGAHFPPTDEKWKGAASSTFLAEAVARVRARGGVIAHLDVTYLGEGPKVGPHREAMRASIAAIAGIAVDRVGVQATTNEGLGFIGRGEGAAAYAVATVRLPFPA